MTTPISPSAIAAPVQHGGLRPAELRALGIDSAGVIDFSANVNPLGPSPRVREALAVLDPSRYPDPEALDLRTALAARHGVGPEQICAGNGATELIHLVARAFLAPGDTAVVLSPTFGEYERAASLAGAAVVPIPDSRMLRWAVAALTTELCAIRPRVVFCCNPNNPTGQYLDEGSVRALLDAAAPGLLVLDEAYVPFVQRPWSSLPLLDSGRALILRSLTKDLALAGLRLGYAIGPADAIAALRAQQPSWSVNAAALAAGLAALGDEEHARRSLVAVAEGRRVLIEGLAASGVPFEPPAANFVLAQVGDGAAVRLALARRGFLVRDCASFGLPGHVRIAARTAPECRALIAALREALR